MICLACVFALVLVPSQCRRNDIAHDQDDEDAGLSIEEVKAVSEDSDEEEDTNKASYVNTAVGLLQSEVDKLAEAAKNKAADVMVKLADYAADVRDKAMSAGAEILQEANMCDLEKRDAAAAMMAKMQSHAAQITDLAAEKWPAVKDKSLEFSKTTHKKIVLLMQLIKDWGMSQAQRAEVQSLLRGMASKYGSIVMAARSKQPTWANKIEETMAAFIEKLSDLSGKLAGLAKNAFQAESTQSILRVIQARSGQLLQAAADKWPQVKKALGRVASATFEKVKQLGAKLGAAMCNPENHERARALFASVQLHVRTLVQAIVDHWPAVKQNFNQFADQVAEHAKNLNTIFMSYASGDKSISEDVQSAFSSVQAQIAALKSQAGAARSDLPGLLLFAARLESRSDIDENEVETTPANSCFFKDVKYHPVNMPGTKRTQVESAEACQLLCADTQGCVHFSYWPNGGCHRQDELAAAMRRAWYVVSGPVGCN